MSTTINLSDGDALMQLFGSPNTHTHTQTHTHKQPSRGLRLFAATNGAEKLQGEGKNMVIDVCDQEGMEDLVTTFSFVDLRGGGSGREKEEEEEEEEGQEMVRMAQVLLSTGYRKKVLPLPVKEEGGGGGGGGGGGWQLFCPSGSQGEGEMKSKTDMYTFDAQKQAFVTNVYLMDLLLLTEFFDEEEGRFVCVTGEEEGKEQGGKEKEDSYVEVSACVRLRVEACGGEKEGQGGENGGEKEGGEGGEGERSDAVVCAQGNTKGPSAVAPTFQSKNKIWCHLNACLGALDGGCWK
jgi:hypothetical protein